MRPLFRRSSVCRLAAAGMVALLLPSLLGARPRLSYPQTRRVEQVDVFHGISVADPYRWLEDDIRQSPEVKSWVEAQNRIAFDYLRAIPERAALEKRLTALASYELRVVPWRAGRRYFFFHNDGLQNQNVLFTQASLREEPQMLLDPNTWSADGTVALSDPQASPDGRYLAYSVAEAGSDWHTYRVLDLATRATLPEELHWSRSCCAAWTEDGKGFFYGHYPPPAKGTEYQAAAKGGRIYYHRVGTPQEADTVVFEQPDQPGWSLFAEVTEGGRYLVITVAKETGERFRILVRDLTDPLASPRVLVREFTNEYFTLVGNEGSELFFRTDFDAPRGRVIAIDVLHPERERWREVLPEGKGTLRGVIRVGNLLLAHAMEDASSHLRVFTLAGKPVQEIELPGIGTVTNLNGKQSDSEAFFGFSSFNTPPSAYRYDLGTGAISLLFRAKIDVQPESYTVERVSFPSKDGTRVPMFLAYKKGLPRDGNRPTLLFGYGGFNIPTTPTFSAATLAWIERGGIYALPILRGGGEYGEAWHQAGMKLKKQNVFDDFIGAAEWLIKERYTRPARLAIQGASNGGLLVGAALTQRPELFAVALPHAGVLDMLRFQRFTVGRLWVHEYGSVDVPEEFRALYAYSPYHNIREGKSYPATLIDTADTDDRVVPGHSFKFAAELQRAQAGDRPILLRVETRAGHGAGLPKAKEIEVQADRLAFLVENVERR
jgi:prolyl oligopeptidase